MKSFSKQAKDFGGRSVGLDFAAQAGCQVVRLANSKDEHLARFVRALNTTGDRFFLSPESFLSFPLAYLKGF